MLLIVTVGMVIVALVLLIFGFAEDSLVYIYLSILCSVAAAVVLTIFTRISRRRALRLAGGTGEDLFDEPATVEGRRAAAGVGQGPDAHPRVRSAPEAGTSVTDAVPPRSGGAGRSRTPPPTGASPAEGGAAARPGDPPAPPRSAAAPLPEETGRPPSHGRSAVGPEWAPRARDPFGEPVGTPAGTRRGWEGDDWDDEEVVFPIEDYDSLRVPEILPLLGELDADELEEVRAREVTGRARGTLIKRIDLLLASFSAVREEPAPLLDADTEELPVQPRPAEPAAHPEPAGPAAGRGQVGTFPIPEYDRLRPSEILPRLSELNRQQLDAVAAHEREGLGRRTILVRISRLQGEESGGSDGHS